MTRKVALRPKARADIKSIDTWGSAQGQLYVRELDRAMQHLAEKPGLGRSCPDIAPGLRVHSSGKHLVFYLRTDKAIDVIRILHQRMDPARPSTSSWGRELLDHVVVLGERYLRRLIRSYVAYHHEERCHLGLAKAVPRARPLTPRSSATAKVVALPRVGGLHHRYERREAA